MAEVKKQCFFLLKIFIIINSLTKSVFALDIIRDVELERFTDDIVNILLNSQKLHSKDLNIYFINSDQEILLYWNNIFINTELIIIKRLQRVCRF